MIFKTKDKWLSVDSHKWDLRYLEMARQVSLWSKDPSTKLGAVAIGSDGQILSQGYNGFPRGVDDIEERLENREIKYDFIVHAEMNCIYNACLNGVSLKGSTLYIHGLPACHKCAPGIIQVGVKRVVMAYPADGRVSHWLSSWDKSQVMFDESGVNYLGIAYGSASEHWFDDVWLALRSRHQ